MASVIRGSGESTLGGALDVQGVLTYEDVTSVDSVGIVTAREGIRVGSGKSIGIGTDGPVAPLHVHSTAYPTAIIQRNHAINYPRLRLVNVANDGADLDGIGNGGSTPGGFRISCVAAGVSTERFRITSAGLVGIGCDPETDFQVRNGNGGTAKIGGSGTSATGFQITYNNSGTTSTELLTNYRATSGNASFKIDTGTFIIATGTSGDEKLRITSGGDLFVAGTGGMNTTQLPNGSTININGTGSNDGFSVIRYNAGYGAYGLNIGRSKSGTLGTNAAVTDGNDLGHITFYGADGSSFLKASMITSQVDGTPNSGMPGRLIFKTTPNGSATPEERLSIDSSGLVRVGHPTANHGSNVTQDLEIKGRYVNGAGNFSRLIFANSNDSGGSTASIRAERNGNNFGTELTFFTNPQSSGGDGLERLRINRNGFVGINEDIPNSQLSVNYTGTQTTSSFKTATHIRLDGTSGANTISGIGFGYMNSGGNDYYPSAWIGAKVSSWTSYVKHDLVFATRGVDTNTEPTERLRINANGRVDIGDETGVAHAGEFQVINTSGAQQDNDALSFFETNSPDWVMMTNYNASGTHYHMRFMQQGGVKGSITGSNGSNVSFTPGSDYRWKENVVDLTGTEGIDFVKNLKPRKFNWIDNRINTGEINTVNGFIAHEVEEAGIGHLVYGNGKDAVKEDGSIDGQTLDYAGMTPVLAAAIKGLIDKVETLESKVAALEG